MDRAALTRRWILPGAAPVVARTDAHAQPHARTDGLAGLASSRWSPCPPCLLQLPRQLSAGYRSRWLKHRRDLSAVRRSHADRAAPRRRGACESGRSPELRALRVAAERPQVPEQQNVPDPLARSEERPPQGSRRHVQGTQSPRAAASKDRRRHHPPDRPATRRVPGQDPPHDGPRTPPVQQPHVSHVRAQWFVSQAHAASAHPPPARLEPIGAPTGCPGRCILGTEEPGAAGS
jgi:hypothetical protein